MRTASLFTLLALAACTNKGGDDTDLDTGSDTDPGTEVDTDAALFDVVATATGLINGSATLTLNGSDVVLEQNGSITLDEALSTEDVIDVQVTAPTGQTCTVDAPTGPVTGDVDVTLTCTCDWISGVEFNQYDVAFAVNGLGAHSTVSTTRGFDAAFNATCGGVQHRVLDSGTPLDPPEGSDWTAATFLGISTLAVADDAVYAIGVIQSTQRGGPPIARVLYRAAAPTFTPQPLLAQIDGVTTDGSIASIEEFAVGPDGTVAALVQRWSDSTRVQQTLIYDGTDWVDGVIIDPNGDNPGRCDLRNVVVTGPGEATVLGISGAPCLADGARRGVLTTTFSELLAFDESGASRQVLSVGNLLANGNTVTELYSTQTGAPGQILAAVGQCPPNQLCAAYTGTSSPTFDGIVRIDLSTDAATPLMTVQEDANGFTPISFDGPWSASPAGDAVAFASTFDSTCEGRCLIEPALIRSVDGTLDSLTRDVESTLQPSDDVLDGGLSLNADGTVVFVSEAMVDLRGQIIPNPSVLCWADALVSVYGPTSTSDIDTTLTSIDTVWSAGPGQWAALGLMDRRGFNVDTLVRGVCAE